MQGAAARCHHVFAAAGWDFRFGLAEMAMTASFGVLGHVFIKLGCEGAALLLGFVPGPMMEENCRRSLLLSCGDFGVLHLPDLAGPAAGGDLGGDRGAAGDQVQAR